MIINFVIIQPLSLGYYFIIFFQSIFYIMINISIYVIPMLFIKTKKIYFNTTILYMILYSIIKFNASLTKILSFFLIDNFEKNLIIIIIFGTFCLIFLFFYLTLLIFSKCYQFFKNDNYNDNELKKINFEIFKTNENVITNVNNDKFKYFKNILKLIIYFPIELIIFLIILIFLLFGSGFINIFLNFYLNLSIDFIQIIFLPFLFSCSIFCIYVSYIGFFKKLLTNLFFFNVIYIFNI
jgi:hypothetical protein